MGGCISPPVVSRGTPLYGTVIGVPGDSTTFTASVSYSHPEDESSTTIAMYFDGGYIGAYLSHQFTGSTGTHTVRVVASNPCGSSEAIWDWEVYECTPQEGEEYINFGLSQFQIGSSNFTEAVCNENAIARFLWSGNSSQFVNQSSQFNWKGKTSSCPGHNSTPPQYYNKPIYIVHIGLEYPGFNFQHDVIGELIGSDPYAYLAYRYMQYNNNDIRIGVGDPDDPSFIQIPKGYGSASTTVTINRVTDIIITESPPSIRYTPERVAEFTIDNLGTVTRVYPPP